MRLSSAVVVLHWGCLPLRLSSIDDVFHWGDLPYWGCLTNSPSKFAYNARVKTKLMDYWEQKLRMEASTLDSILFFKPAYMSLRRPHPLWLQPISSIQCLYGCKDAFWQVSYWYAAETRTNNNSGRCLLSACKELFVPGSLEHILLFCPSIQPKRLDLLNLEVDFQNKKTNCNK